MKVLLKLFCAAGLLTTAALAQTPVTVTIDSQKPAGPAIPDDFIGLSFGMRSLLPDADGNYFFSPTNKRLVTIFQNLGIRHLRLGGTTVESPPKTAIPGPAEIDSAFAFVKAAGVKRVIYSLRLLETNHALNYAATNAHIAAYIWNRYRPWLEAFSIGNEPDLHRVFKQDADITDFTTYLHKWREFASAVTNAAPGAKFAGPDGSGGNMTWTLGFAEAEKNSGILDAVTEHFYVGGAGRNVPPEKGIEQMLSMKWLLLYQKLYEKVTTPIVREGLTFRFTEANDHYSGGVQDASDTAAGALWALDFLHWWAGHDAKSVDFHNTQWVVNDIITRDSNEQLAINPKGYGLKAFDLGSGGSIEPVTISNPKKMNLTAYSVRGKDGHFVTIINKEYGTDATIAEVTIAAADSANHAEVIFLSVPNSDAAAKTGVTLGGAAITDDSPWTGKWTSLASDHPGQFRVKVPAVSAAIVKISSGR